MWQSIILAYLVGVASVVVYANIVIVYNRIRRNSVMPDQVEPDESTFFLQTYRLGVESSPCNSCTMTTDQPEIDGVFDLVSRHPDAKAGDIIFIININTQMVEGLCRMEWDRKITSFEVEPCAVNKERMGHTSICHLANGPRIGLNTNTKH